MPKAARINQATIARGVALILQGIGADLKDPNFRGTPARVARMYAELLTPTPSSWNSFPAESSDIIMLRGHRVVGICPHHLLPVSYRCTVGYIPDHLTVGLSKLARVVEQQCIRPILQEDLANHTAMMLEEKLRPKGVGVVLMGTHGCMTFRGVRTHGDIVSSVMRGILHTDSAARAEFLQLATMQHRQAG